jgi:ornithine decarboxylase
MGQFDKAFRDARVIFDYAAEMGIDMQIIDIGGGFPGVDTDKATFRQVQVGAPSKLTFRQIAGEINTAIDKHFGDVLTQVRFIGEPGRFMCTSSHTLVNTIIGIKATADSKTGEKVYLYTIDDTVYGSFNCIKYDYAVPQFQAFNERTEKTFKSTIFGQSCDSMDKELNGTEYSYLPKLAIGDRVFVTNFGAYTCASSSSFNGFTPPGKHYIIRS